MFFLELITFIKKLAATHIRVRRMPKVSCLAGSTGRVNAVRFLEPQPASSAYLVSGGEDKHIRLWNAAREEGGRLLHTFANGHGAEILDVAIAPGGLRIASCGLDRAAYLWDVASGASIGRLFGHEAKINACAFRRPDGAVLATGSDDGTVRVWDCRTSNKSPVQTLPRFKDAVTCVLVDESSISATSVDGALSVYDVRAGTVGFAEQLVRARGPDAFGHVAAGCRCGRQPAGVPGAFARWQVRSGVCIGRAGSPRAARALFRQGAAHVCGPCEFGVLAVDCF
jgi:hypothetical protein